MRNFEKVIRIGTVDCGRRASVFCKIKYEHDCLTISGVVGPLPSGNAIGSCGQINLANLHFKRFARGWNQEMVNMLRAIWDEYHLNDRVAGSPAQELYLKHNPCDDRMNHYEQAVKRLTAAGLNPDPNNTNPMTGKPYEYGSAWLRKDVPEWALEWLYNLPEADQEPAWI